MSVACGRSREGSPGSDTFLGWLSRDDDALVKYAGLDACTFVWFMWFCVKLFSILAVLAAVTLIPVNATGGVPDSLSNPNSTEATAGDIDNLSLSNVESAASVIWVHWISVYGATTPTACSTTASTRGPTSCSWTTTVVLTEVKALAQALLIPAPQSHPRRH